MLNGNNYYQNMVVDSIEACERPKASAAHKLLVSRMDSHNNMNGMKDVARASILMFSSGTKQHCQVVNIN